SPSEMGALFRSSRAFAERGRGLGPLARARWSDFTLRHGLAHATQAHSLGSGRAASVWRRQLRAEGDNTAAQPMSSERTGSPALSTRHDARLSARARSTAPSRAAPFRP